MSRLDDAGEGLIHVRTFEFLLPEAFTLGVYCRSDESSREVLSVAAQVGILGVEAYHAGIVRTLLYSQGPAIRRLVKKNLRRPTVDG